MSFLRAAIKNKENNKSKKEKEKETAKKDTANAGKSFISLSPFSYLY